MPIGQSAYKDGERRPVDVLRHEAGHMIVARLLGFDTGDLIYKASHGGAEINLSLHLANMEAVSHYIEDRIVILYAGAMAEALKNFAIDNSLVLNLLDCEEASNDFAKVRELLKILTGMNRGDREFQSALTENNDRLWSKCGSIVEKYAKDIEGVSKEFRIKLGGATEMSLNKNQIEEIDSVAAIKLGGEAEQAYDKTPLVSS